MVVCGASLFHGTERNGADQFRVLFDGTEQRWNGKNQRSIVCVCTFLQVAKVFGVSAIPQRLLITLRIPQLSRSILTESIPPVEPKAGEMYFNISRFRS